MIYFQVYLIENIANGKTYIGKHKIDSRKNDGYFGSGKHLRLAIKKYGKENFRKYELEVCETEEQVNFLEKRYIAFYRLGGKAEYNIANGGDGGAGHTGKKHSEETKRKMSKAGRNKTKETRIKISLAKKGKKYRLGKKHSEETKQKMSVAHKNMTDETKRKISESIKGKKHSEETKLKMSIAKKNMSDETKKKMSESTKLYWKNKKIQKGVILCGREF